MALIKCPECGKDISNQASVCVHCGFPINDYYKMFEFKRIDNVSSELIKFNNISNVTSLNIPKTDLGGKNVISIGDSAFRGCSSLTSIEIPNSVTSIGANAFNACSSLNELIVSDTNPIYDSRDNCNAIVETNNNKLIYGCKSTIIPNSITSIEENAFSGCSSLTSIEIPDSVTSIGDSAFSSCNSLTSVKIPNSVTIIGSYAFHNCRSLTRIEIPNSVTSIGQNAFSGCNALYKVINKSELPITIGSDEYGYISYYAKIVVNKDGNITYMDDGNEYIETEDEFLFTKENNEYKLIAYLGNKEIVTLPTDINGTSYSIYKIKGVRNVIIPSCITNIEEYAFSGCNSLTSIEIPNSVMSIGQYAFSSCYNLPSIVIPNSVTSLGCGSFRDCIKLTSTKIPNSVTSLGEYAFAYCYNLTGIVIPDSVTNIGYGSFEGGNLLKIYGYDDSYAKTYSEDNSISFIVFKDIELKSQNELIKVQGNNLAIEDNTSLYVNETEEGKENVILELNADNAVLFEIYLQRDETMVQPNGDIVVSVAVPEGYDGKKCKVFYIDDDNNYVSMNASYKDGYMVFTTNHFSKYAVVEYDHIFGDINGDGEVNNKDLMALYKHLVNITVSVNAKTLDTNGDTKINGKDLMRLFMYFSNYEVELY